MKAIIINGPPSSGKDTFGAMIINNYGGQHLQFKDALFEAAMELSNTTVEDWKLFYESKEEPREELDGLSPRGYLIHVSEEVYKPRYGKDYFGKKSAEKLSDGLNVFTDGGFEEELTPIIDKVGVENVLVIRLHRTNCSFKNDSRSYLEPREGLELIDVYDVIGNAPKSKEEIWWEIRGYLEEEKWV